MFSRWLLLRLLGACMLTAAAALGAAESVPLAGTKPLAGERDFSTEMRASFRRFFQAQIDDSVRLRATHWNRDFSSRAAYEKSIEPNRERLRKIIGVVDSRIKFSAPELVAAVDRPTLIGETDTYTVRAVRWPVLEGVWAEGLLLDPKGKTLARIVAIPDADQTPEMLVGLAPGLPPESRFAARLASAGCQVIVPVLINRSDEFSGNPAILMTNQTHREWIHRQAFEMGRHIIGYEAQKVMAAIDWFAQRNASERVAIGVAGYGEGGLIALYSAAIDPRIEASLVSGYFDSRQGIADEPLYRDVFGLLVEFGDAEIASLIAPRPLVIECSEVTPVPGPPPVRDNRRASGAPGRIETPPVARVRQETERLTALFAGQKQIVPTVTFVTVGNGKALAAGSDRALTAFLRDLKINTPSLQRGPSGIPAAVAGDVAATDRQHRQFEQLVEYNQSLMRLSAGVRDRFWAEAQPKSAATWPAVSAKYRDLMWDNLIGRYPMPSIPPNAQTRQIDDRPKFVVYEVLLDVTPEVFAWGYLLVPKDLKAGEKRPV
ncbi:MAG: hypothetical protein RIQ93_3032, partial [Verrucomicrobiota bacterium]